MAALRPSCAFATRIWLRFRTIFFSRYDERLTGLLFHDNRLNQLSLRPPFLLVDFEAVASVGVSGSSLFARAIEAPPFRFTGLVSGVAASLSRPFAGVLGVSGSDELKLLSSSFRGVEKSGLLAPHTDELFFHGEDGWLGWWLAPPLLAGELKEL
jgi:hypothetical protein